MSRVVPRGESGSPRRQSSRSAMKYSYTPTNGLSTSSPGQTSPAIKAYNAQTPQPNATNMNYQSQKSASFYSSAVPTPTPLYSSQSSFGAQQQQQRQHQYTQSQSQAQSQQPQANRPTHSHQSFSYGGGQQHGGRVAGYTPVNFDSPYGSADRFYGSLVDPLSARPSEIFSRLADALFFWMDSNCDIAGLRSTGVIEPEKYAWMTLVTGTDLETAKLLVHYIQSFYESAGIPCQYRMGPNGRTIAVLDRRGWLHASVFEARADPEESWKYWSKSITLLTLIDPLTSRPFPSPLPRSALPTHPVPSLRAIYTSWQIQTVADVQRQRSAEAVQQAMANARTQAAQAQMYQNSYVGAAAAAGLGATPGFGSSVSGVSGIGGGGGGSGLGGGEGGEHASLKDTITSVASLANTALNIFGGGGGGGGGLGLGNVVLGLGGIGAFNGFGN